MKVIHMGKIDIHVHARVKKVTNFMGTDTSYATAEELLAMYEKLGIEKGVILPEVNPECATCIQSNEEVMDIVDKYPERFDWFCNIDPRMGGNSPSTDLSYYLTYYKKLGAKGVGELCCNLYFDDPMVENLFYHCEKMEMPVIFHIGPQIGGCYGLVDEQGLKRLEKELAKFPKLKFIGHSQPFWAEIGADIDNTSRQGYPKGKVIPGRLVELMRKYPNLYGDLSADSGYNALTRDPEFGYRFMEEFKDRLLFGTDICSPKNDMQLSFWIDKAVEDNKISNNTYEKICRENAIEILM
jgi:predicted TIM-barrel fold metal-dependent hydrolase